MKKLLVVLFICGLFSACEPNGPAGVSQNNFFDLSDFVLENIADQSIYASVKRTVKIQDENEVKNLLEYDMTDPLTFLVQFNINRPRWSDKYEKKQQGSSTIYKAVDEDMKIRVMEIILLEEEVAEIRIDFSSKTLISKSDKHIVYKPGSLLSIETVSDPLVGDSKKTLVSWEF